LTSPLPLRSNISYYPVFVFLYLACHGLMDLARKHAQHVGLFIATEDFVVVDLENAADMRDPRIEEGELNEIVQQATIF
jgi:hypothetical protein